jgi:ectoine hydroxylase-related dioxygenase (phytanoyl-CoA dioxygenase family)
MSLPDLAEGYALSAERFARYRRDGHILLRGVASPEEMTAYRPVIVEAAMRYNTQTRPLEERDTYGKAFLQIMNLGEKDEAVHRFTRARRFARLAAELMGVDGVRILHDQALFKEPGGGITPWHQDQLYWPLDTNDTITMWMPLVDIAPEVGSMTFVSGSHALDYHEMTAISDESEEILQRHVDSHDLPMSTYGAMSAGDATFHAGWTMHRAPANPSQTMREVMTIIYFADGARLLDTLDGEHRSWVTEWYRTARPGSPLVDPRTPLVYRRAG